MNGSSIKPRCKPGDLAVVVDGGEFDENVGRFLQVVRPAGVDDCHNPEGVFAWVVRAKQPMVGTLLGVRLRDGAIVSTQIERRIEWVYMDDCLQPIRGASRKATSTRRSKTREVQHG